MKKYAIAFLIWVMIIPIAILNGGFREYVLVNLGMLALPLSEGSSLPHKKWNKSSQYKY